MRMMSASAPRGVSDQVASSPARARATSGAKRERISSSVALPPENQKRWRASSSSGVVGAGSNQYERTLSASDKLTMIAHAPTERNAPTPQPVHPLQPFSVLGRA